MIRLTIETDSIANANFLAAFLRTVKSVKKVVVEKPSSEEMRVEEPSAAYNWTNPSRPATDEEIERMLDECENSPTLTAEEAKEATLNEIRKWRTSK